MTKKTSPTPAPENEDRIEVTPAELRALLDSAMKPLVDMQAPLWASCLFDEPAMAEYLKVSPKRWRSLRDRELAALALVICRADGTTPPEEARRLYWRPLEVMAHLQQRTKKRAT